MLKVTRISSFLINGLQFLLTDVFGMAMIAVIPDRLRMQSTGKKKRTRNIEHDKAITNLFERRGWSVIRIWECELKKKNRAILDEKLSIITSLPKKS